MRGGRGRRSRGGGSQVQRQVKSILRRDLLTTSTGWVRNKTRNCDPPEYLYEPIIQRRVRAIAHIDVTGLIFTPFEIGAAHGMYATFRNVKVNRVDVWGKADGTTISLAAEFDGYQKTFTDVGVTGSRRSHVSIAISPRDAEWYAVSDQSELFTVRLYDEKATLIAGNCIVDFHCQFYGNVIPDLPSEDTPMGFRHPSNRPALSETSLQKSMSSLSVSNTFELLPQVAPSVVSP